MHGLSSRISPSKFEEKEASKKMSMAVDFPDNAHALLMDDPKPKETWGAFCEDPSSFAFTNFEGFCAKRKLKIRKADTFAQGAICTNGGDCVLNKNTNMLSNFPNATSVVDILTHCECRSKQRRIIMAMLQNISHKSTVADIDEWFRQQEAGEDVREGGQPSFKKNIYYILTPYSEVE